MAPHTHKQKTNLWVKNWGIDCSQKRQRCDLGEISDTEANSLGKLVWEIWRFLIQSGPAHRRRAQYNPAWLSLVYVCECVWCVSLCVFCLQRRKDYKRGSLLLVLLFLIGSLFPSSELSQCFISALLLPALYPSSISLPLSSFCPTLLTHTRLLTLLGIFHITSLHIVRIISLPFLLGKPFLNLYSLNCLHQIYLQNILIY